MVTSFEDVIAGSMIFPYVVVHGRFQPPLHINHFTYINNAFCIGEHVKILITNPMANEKETNIAPHRSKSENNPFTYDERIKIFRAFLNARKILPSRYSFAPFDITDDEAWDKLDKNDVYLVNTYSPWSEKKFAKFSKKGFKVIHSTIRRKEDISGTLIRSILKKKISMNEKKKEFIRAGYMPEAIEGLLCVVAAREKK